MKHVVLFLICIGAAQNLIAQKLKTSDVPEVVKAALAKEYAAKDAWWNKEDGNFEASFKKDGKEISLVIDPTGKTVESETEIAKAELPTAALQLLKAEYADYHIEEAARIEASGIVTYEAEVEKSKNSYDLIFDSSGKLLSKEAKGDRD